MAFVFNRMRISEGDGIVMQALTWAKALRDRGHTVDLISPWEFHELEDYDVVQIFGRPYGLAEDVRAIRMKNQNVVIAPIVDPFRPLWVDRLFSYYGINKPLLVSPNFSLRNIRKMVKYCLTRSEYERDWIVKAFGYRKEQCPIIKLSNGVDPLPYSPDRENFCLHISRLGDPGKNVKRLIEASEKYKFKLVLCGPLRGEKARRDFESWTEGKHYVEYKGYVTEEEKKDLCQRAKVFALPSLIEGVGLSALEAATWGCDIVVTSYGGPKEYYSDLAKVVNPLSVDDIGQAVRYFLDGHTYQPALRDYIVNEYSDAKVAENLEQVYLQVVGESK